MTEKTPGAEALVREGAELLEDAAEYGPLPCVVRHEAAGGQCERTAIMEVYGLAFCEAHGAEAKAGALEELYFDAAGFLGRLDNPYVPEPNPAALVVLREAVSELRGAEIRASEREEILRRAYPLIPERMEEDAADFDYQDPGRGDTPMDWNYNSRMLIHKLMRIAHEAGSDHYLVEMLEEEREHVSAQLAFALADYEERAGDPTSK